MHVGTCIVILIHKLTVYRTSGFKFSQLEMSASLWLSLLTKVSHPAVCRGGLINARGDFHLRALSW